MDEYNYSPDEAIRIAEDRLPKLGENHIFSSRYILSNMRQMKKKAEKHDELMSVWVPRGYYSTSKIKEDDIQMYILEAE